MTLHIVCFSKDRPLQLHGYLKSLLENTYPQSNMRISVIINPSPDYVSAYQELNELFSQVEFIREQDFYQDLSESITDSDYVMFGCDDVLFMRPLMLRQVEQIMSNPNVLCLTLRLGVSVQVGMFGSPMPQPHFLKYHADPAFISWDVSDPASTGDWAYPWEVLGTIYRTDFVRTVIQQTHPASPSQLEERGSKIWQDIAPQRLMVAWQLPRIVIPTINVVQSEFPNGIIGEVQLDPAFLLTCWQHKLRIATRQYANLAFDSWRIGQFYLERIA